MLDSGLGSCVLRDVNNAKVVADALLFFDKNRYHMGDFIIMPNHVHLLVKPCEGWTLSHLLQSWKRHTSREINLRIGHSGKLWQPESYDHVIRNEQQLLRIQKYIKENPINLSDAEFFYYQATQSRTGLQPVDNLSQQPSPHSD